MRTRYFILVCCIFFLIGMPRIFTLSAHWSADESRWIQRSSQFIESVQSGNFKQTLIAYHPGVTTMWLAGIRVLLFKNAALYTPLDLARARWFIGVTLLATLCTICFLIHRLLNFRQALLACGFLCLNPFFLAQSRRVHIDALATIFILLTILLFLYFCIFPKQRHYVALSGIAFGLACLSKGYSLLLLLWIPLCISIFRPDNTTGINLFLHTLRTGLLFLNCTLLTVYAIWPLFWHPTAVILGISLLLTVFLQLTQRYQKYAKIIVGLTTLNLIAGTGYVLKKIWLLLDKINWELTTPHEVEQFFFGNVVADPGWLFYPFVLFIKNTPFVLPLAIGAILFLFKNRQNPRFAQHSKIAISIGAAAILFTLCLSLTTKKLPRYLLPAFPMLDILAGMGAFYTAKWIGTHLKKQRLRRIAQVAYFAIILLLTTIPVFALHPYYGTYYNICWKPMDITKTFTVGDASGLEIAAKYLNQKHNAGDTVVQVSTTAAESFEMYFVGNIYQIPPKHIKNAPPSPPVDYEVVYIRDSQIQWVLQEGTLGGTLEHVITLNGVDHVWIYRVQQVENR